MEKRKPHYDLLTVQSAVRLRGADAFTATALIGAQAMGLEIVQALEVVCSMSRSDFLQKYDDSCVKPNLAGCLPSGNACRNSLCQGYVTP